MRWQTHSYRVCGIRILLLGTGPYRDAERVEHASITMENWRFTYSQFELVGCCTYESTAGESGRSNIGLR